jgi:4-hydroxybenzoate polyprenyltransferase
MVKKLFQLIRWKNLIIAGGTVMLSKYAIFEPAINRLFPLSSSSLDFLDTLLLSISVMIIAAGGYIINDINDVKTDQINKPKKNNYRKVYFRKKMQKFSISLLPLLEFY